MITGYLKRIRREADGVFGTLLLRDDAGRELTLFTGEPPRCIPAGTYTATMARSPRFGRDLYRLKGVPGFTGILIHAGNWCVPHGDRPADTTGCVLVGMNHGVLEGKRAVLHSVLALHKLHEWTKGADIALTVVDA